VLEQIWRILRDNPILLLLVGSWVVGGIGSAVRKARERAEQERQAGRRMPMDVPQEDARTMQAEPSRPSEEDVAEKLRRILGELETGGPAAPQRVPAPAARREPTPHSFDADAEEEVREVTVREEPRAVPVRNAEPPALPQRSAPTSYAPRPFVPSTLGRVPVQVQPHVGESMQRRSAPASGAVATTRLGELGGRGPAETRRRSGRPGALVDLTDLRSAIVLREVLDRPLALREGWGR
jgi:hypothetical protein